MADQLISILKQRRIEAAIVKPLVQAFEAELGKEKTRAILAKVIKQLAHDRGRELAAQAGSTSLQAFRDTHGAWRMDNALETEVLKETEEEYFYNVTRCRYAEMYREMGLADLGFTLSCNRDGSLMEGFAPDVEFTRTQTIMQGASYCDFRYRKVKKS